ncbi:ComEC family competence protein [Antarcticibacterium flavum]|uniref:ComEC family competence protein n=1 Tax=Antarcticibacterium flavum TaxID=2058175 RepID=A0A5B7X3N1_9FLAO|nr:MULTISPECIES: ComEC/Rec2 family competence protein [Antarcticibacterium]MCM4160999.1 competence protein [Antarcticibacterium sp. W02-3]QCY69278.1 ComEC family competence protein [Antarcticibacterium flavum]
MLNFTIIKLSLCVLAGILLGNFFTFKIVDVAVFLLLGLLLFIFNYYRARRLFLPDLLFGISSLALFVLIGTTAATLHKPANNPNHYIHYIAEEEVLPITAEVHEILKPGFFQDKYIIKTRQISKNPAKGKLLLNVARDSTTGSLRPGQIIHIAGMVTKLNTPLNPYQFNYSDYMEGLGVLRQINVQPEAVIQSGIQEPGLRNIAGNLRDGIIGNIKKYKFEQDELAIIQALLLGQRQEISQEIYSNYAAAGVIHILAVSGLHVGIILLLLNRLLQPLDRLPKGKVLKAILLLVLLWSFALLAGLSPSIVRAVSMFSFVAIGMQLNRRTSVLNTLFISLLVLLLINPGYISQVGFQLSYAAVFSIVLIQPQLFALYKGENRLIKYFWGILTVTVAAQIGVLPLSLFYFHQFPGLFFLTNLLILPFLGIILGAGILVLLLAAAGWLPELLARAFGWMISVLNEVVAFIAAREDFIFENISFSLLLCLVSYLLVAGFILLLKKINYPRIIYFLVSIALLQVVFLIEKHQVNHRETIIFHKSRNSAIGFKSDRKLLLFHDMPDAALSYSFVRDYITEKDINKTTEVSIRNIYEIENKRLLRIDSSGIYQLDGLTPNVLLLSQSPRINLERAINELQPALIIADGSNYPSAVKRWKETAKKAKLPFHATGEKGAFVFAFQKEDH